MDKFDEKQLKDIIGQVIKKNDNKNIDSYEIYQVDCKDITLEIISGNMKDVFVIYPIDLDEESKKLLESRYDLRIRYSNTINIESGEELYLAEKMTTASKDLYELPTVRNLIMKDNIILNHTMGSRFLSGITNKGFIYSKTIHDNKRHTEDYDNILFFFGPFSLELRVGEDKVILDKK